MNDLGTSIIWLAVQVTVLCGVVLAMNVLIRKSGRLSGSPSMAALMLTVVLTAALFSPWPRWNWKTPERSEASEQAAAAESIETQTALAGSEQPAALPDVELESTTTAALTGFLSALRNEVVSPTPRESTTRLRWTGWLAMGVIAMFMLGALRLLAGWISVTRCVKRSTAVDDPAVREALDILQAEMSCTRSVRLCESREVTSAATLGWRRPVILLPVCWREWSPGERRMVLAHELAHIESGDAAAWLVAQLSLLLHFYHPLVHWLVNCLRLEQELAADARAAELSGGSQTYLKTLAALAVRQPDCSVAWPARAFLPTRGTFLRRIEMLRNTKTLAGRSSPWRRRAVVAVTLATGLFVAGIRRPAMVQVTAAEPITGATAVAQSSDLNFENVPADTVLLLALRPAQLAAREELQPIVEFVEESLDVEKTGVGLNDVDQFLVMASASKSGENAPRVSQPLMEVRTTVAMDFGAYIRHHLGQTTEQTSDGITLHSKGDIARAPQAEAVWIVDDRTLIQGRADAILALARSNRTGSRAPEWVDRLKSMENIQFGFGLDVAFVRPGVEQEFRRNPNPMLGMVAPLWQNTNVAMAVAQLDKDLGLTIHGWAADDAGAEKIKDTVTMLLPVATGMMQGAKASAQDVPPDMRETVIKGIDLAVDALNTADVAQDGNHVTLSLSGDGLSVATMAGLLLPAVQQAREAARRTQSTNNVRQIMLGLHNYHGANGNFPPPVLLGPDGKTKHSWRVAILPYIEQPQLYEQYNMSEPWDSPGNLKVLAQIPFVFHHPKDDAGSTNASYFAIISEHTAFGNTPGEGNKLRDFVDGSSNTLMVFEAKRDIPWTKPEDIPYADGDPIPKLGGWHNGGYNAGFADGAVRFIAESVDETLLRNLIKRDDGNAVNF